MPVYRKALRWFHIYSADTLHVEFKQFQPERRGVRVFDHFAAEHDGVRDRWCR